MRSRPRLRAAVFFLGAGFNSIAGGIVGHRGAPLAGSHDYSSSRGIERIPGLTHPHTPRRSFELAPSRAQHGAKPGSRCIVELTRTDLPLANLSTVDATPGFLLSDRRGR